MISKKEQQVNVIRYSRRKRAKFIILVLLFSAISLVSVIYIDYSISPLIRDAAVRRVRSAATYVISNAVCECLEQENITYDDLVTFEKDNNGKITALKTDSMRMNYLKSRLSSQIHDSLADIKSDDISFPLGNVLSSGILMGKGPNVDISVYQIGDVSTDFVNEFVSAGINQTAHRLMIKIDVAFSVIMPLRNTPATVSTSICAAETVIVGEIPEAFTNVQNFGGTEGETVADEVVDFGAQNFHN